jgi:hypothetical protein
MHSPRLQSACFSEDQSRSHPPRHLKHKELLHVDQSVDFYSVMPSLYLARILSNECVPAAHL